MILTGIYQRARNKSRLADLRFKQMKLQDQLRDLAEYSSNIADGIITPEEMSKSPNSIFGRQMMFANRSLAAAYMKTNMDMYFYGPQIMNQMRAMGGNPQMMSMMDPRLSPMAQMNPQFAQMAQMNPMGAMMYMTQTNFMQRNLEACGKAEQKRIHVEEKKLQSELDRLKIQIQMLEAEDKELAQAVSREIKESAPKYTA